VEKFSTTTSACAISCARQRQAFGVLQVQRHAALAAVAPQEGAALVGQLRQFRRVAAQVVAAPGRLDLDHVGTQVGQEHRGQRAGDEVREVDDAHALQRQRRARRARGVRREFVGQRARAWGSAGRVGRQGA
jgi:hypothetical protein